MACSPAYKEETIIPKLAPLGPQKCRERSWSPVYRDAQHLPFTSSYSCILSCSHWAFTVTIGVMLWCVGVCTDCWHQSQGNPEDGAQIQQVFGHPCSTKSPLELGVVVASSTLRRLRHKDYELMVSLDCLARPCLKMKTSHAQGVESLAPGHCTAEHFAKPTSHGVRHNCSPLKGKKAVLSSLLRAFSLSHWKQEEIHQWKQGMVAHSGT